MFKFVFASMARGGHGSTKRWIQAYPNLIADRIGRERIELSTLATPVDTTTLVLEVGRLRLTKWLLHTPRERPRIV